MGGECHLCTGKAENTLKCGHRCCEECRDILRAQTLVEKFVRGRFYNVQAENEPMCVQCKSAGRDGGSVDVDRVLERIREFMGVDWEKHFEEAEEKLGKMVGDFCKGTEALKELEEARKDWDALEQKKRDCLKVLQCLLDTVVKRGMWASFAQQLLGIAYVIAAIALKVDVVVQNTDMRVVVQKPPKRHIIENTDVSSWKARDAEIKIFFTEVDHGGTVFDPVRRMAISNSWKENVGKNIYVTHFDDNGDGRTEVKEDEIPFSTYTRPMFDGVRFVYFQGSSYNLFGRLDIESMKFEMLREAPFEFGGWNGFYSEGYVYCFERGTRKGKRFDPLSGEWEDSYLRIEGVQMVAHPWGAGRAIEIMKDGTVRIVLLKDGSVLKSYNAKYGEIKEHAEMVAICAGYGEFFLVVCDGSRERGGWKVFLSTNDEWAEADWWGTKGNTDAAFFDPVTEQLFYHTNGRCSWNAVKMERAEVIRPSSTDIDEADRMCTLCGCEKGTVSLECGHVYCETCRNNLQAYIVCVEFSRGNVDAKVGDAVCIACNHSPHTGKMPNDVQVLCEDDANWDEICEATRTKIVEEERRREGIMGQMKNDCISRINRVRYSQKDFVDKKNLSLEVERDIATRIKDNPKCRGYLTEVERIVEGLGKQQGYSVDVRTVGDKVRVLCKFNGEPVILETDPKKFEKAHSSLPTWNAFSGRFFATFDPVRRLIVEVSPEYKEGKYIFITRLNEDGSGWTEKIKNVLAFNPTKNPIYDGEKYMYFNNYGGKFARLDLDTFEFKELQSARRMTIEKMGLFLNDCVCFYVDGIAMRYSTKEQCWLPDEGYTTDVQGSCMNTHPWEADTVITLTKDGELKEMHSSDLSVTKRYDETVPGGSMTDSIALRSLDGEFIFMAAKKRINIWKVFPSHAAKWADVTFNTAENWSHTSFLDPLTHRLYYHTNASSVWHAIQLD